MGRLSIALLTACVACGDPVDDETTAAEETALSTGTGLTGTYFDDVALALPKVTRLDPTVDFAWGTAQPATGVAPTTFSVRWVGQVEAPTSAVYTFFTRSDDGVRLWIEGKLLIDNWTNHAATDNSGTVSLVAGHRYDVRLEFFQNTGGSEVHLSWSRPGHAKAIVPQARLYPDAPVRATVTARIDTTLPRALPPRFSGFCAEDIATAVSLHSPSYIQTVKAMTPGWIRYPGGTSDDAFDWRTGDIVDSWIDALPLDSNAQAYSKSLRAVLRGKGGLPIADFKTMLAGTGAHAIVVINGFTDTPQSAHDLAAYCKANGIVVDEYELSNEPYLYEGNVWASGTAYADAMRPYRDAIKSADPSAVVGVFYSGSASTAWDRALAAYPDKYWDAISFHQYPGYNATGSTFAEGQAILNDALVKKSTVIADRIVASNGPTKIFLTELNAGKALAVWGTLYNALFLAEYTARMTTHPMMSRVGPYVLYGGSAHASIHAKNDHEADARKAYANHTTIDTSGLDFGFYPTADGVAMTVANVAFNTSTALYPTTTSGGPTVPTSASGAIPAVFAQAYRATRGKTYLLVTNKSDSAQTLDVQVGGASVGATFTTTTVAGPPDAINTAATPDTVVAQTSTVRGAIPLPPFSLTRVEW